MATSVVFVLSLFILPMLHCDDSRASLKSVIESLEKLISFYKGNYMNINVDGLFGLRVVEGHINLLLKEHQQNHHEHLEDDTLLRMRKMLSDCVLTGNKAIEFVKKEEESYYNSFKFVVNGPWGLFKRHREIDPQYKWKPKVYSGIKNSQLDEETSDKCMGELTGDQRDDQKKCMISDSCLDAMTEKGRTEYGITHQILWTMLAEKAGCLDALNKVLLKKGYSSVAEMQLEFCTNNYYEMVAVVHIYMKGIITSDYQDLFLEQQFVCPSVGFYQYLKKSYLTQILSWQRESGCFANLKHESLKYVQNVKKNLALPVLKYKQNEHSSIKLQSNMIDKIQPNRKQNVIQQIQNHQFNVGKEGLRLKDYVERNSVQGKPQQLAHVNVLQFSQQGYKTQSRQTRRLLLEKTLEDGCLSHKTAVAAGALAMYLRYLIDPGPLNLTAIHPILPESSRSLLEEAKLHDFQNQKVKGEGLIPVRQELGEELVLNQGDDQEAVEDGEDEDGGDAGEQTEEDEDEDMDDVDNNYKEDDMYPDKADNPNIHDKKVVRFGNGNKAGLELEKNKFEDDGNILDHDDDGDNEQKVNLFQAGVRGGNPDQQENKDDEEYTYYDPPDKDLDKDVDFEKKERDPSVQKHVHRNKKKANSDETQRTVYGSDSIVIKSKPDDRTLFIVLSVSVLIVIFLMYRFIKKRRIHIRFSPRKLFKL